MCFTLFTNAYKELFSLKSLGSQLYNLAPVNVELLI